MRDRENTGIKASMGEGLGAGEKRWIFLLFFSLFPLFLPPRGRQSGAKLDGTDAPGGQSVCNEGFPLFFSFFFLFLFFLRDRRYGIATSLQPTWSCWTWKAPFFFFSSPPPSCRLTLTRKEQKVERGRGSNSETVSHGISPFFFFPFSLPLLFPPPHS